MCFLIPGFHGDLVSIDGLGDIHSVRRLLGFQFSANLGGEFLVLYVISIGWVVQIADTSISVISHKSLPSISILASKSLHHFSRQALLGVGAPLLVDD